MDDTAARQDRLGLLAKAPEGAVADLLDRAGDRPAIDWLRAPELGAVMVRGRTGGTGAPFNLGEMTVTRCSLRLACGAVGHAYVMGRRKACAEAAALVDALMQTDAAARIEPAVLIPLRARLQAARQARADKAEATRVDFFTLVRGED